MHAQQRTIDGRQTFGGGHGLGFLPFVLVEEPHEAFPLLPLLLRVVLKDRPEEVAVQGSESHAGQIDADVIKRHEVVDVVSDFCKLA